VSFVLWLLFDVVFSGILEILFEATKSFDTDRQLRSAAILWFAMLGLGGGVLSGALVPDRLLDPGPIPGISLVVAPVAVGIMMQLWGMVRSRASEVSHLATWYGGATLGVGLAAGRLVVLAFIRDVRAI
jgi:hypothetical protein